MGIFTRVKSIVNISVNNALDVIESPEAEIKQVIRDMEKGCTELKKNAASSIANVKMIERNLLNCQTEKNQWQNNAESAVKAGNDDLARKALERRAFFDQRIELLTSQLGDSKSLADKLTTEYKNLDGKLSEAKLKSDMLIAKKRAAEAKKKMFDTSAQMRGLVSSFDLSSGMDKLSSYEDKIAKQMAELEAMEELSGEDNLQQEFSKAEYNATLDDELAALKKKIK